MARWGYLVPSMSLSFLQMGLGQLLFVVLLASHHSLHGRPQLFWKGGPGGAPFDSREYVVRFRPI